MTGCAGGIIIILLLIIVCLVSMRKKGRLEGTNTVHLSTVPASITDGSQGANDYEEHGAVGIGLTSPHQPAGQSAYAYASIPETRQQLPPPPVYAFLDPDASSDEEPSEEYAYAYATRQEMRKQDLGRDAAGGLGGDIQEDVEGGIDPLQSKGQYYAEVRPINTEDPVGNFHGCRSGNRGKQTKEEECEVGFVDNILYVASSDDVIINEQRFGLHDTTPPKKVKGKPRLDPF